MHLFHEAILKFCDRPFENAEHMWKVLKKNWNSTVAQDDEVWVLGDLTLKGKMMLDPLSSMIHGLNGVKHMIVASTHDHFCPIHYEYMGFTSVHYPAIQLENKWYLGHDPALASVWPTGSIYLCGHVHKLWTHMMTATGVLCVNVGVDVRNFTPISEIEIQEIIKNVE
jgi:calcineurin-like phosphoesterase family protein